VCSTSRYSTAAACISAGLGSYGGSCSNPEYLNTYDCTDNGGTWSGGVCLDYQYTDQISCYANSKITNGRITFNGRFRGEYILYLPYKSGRIPIPRTFNLNNLKSNQDLGEIKVPALGSIHFKVTFDPPPNKKNLQLGVYLVRRDGPKKASYSPNLDPKKEDQTVNAVAVGSYDVYIFTQAHKSEPKNTTVLVKRGTTSVVSAVLRPMGSIDGYVIEKNDRRRRKRIQLTKVTITGNNETRELISGNKSLTWENSLHQLISEEDYAQQNFFYFRNLKEGTYELTVEANGYETYRGTRNVIPGEFDYQTSTITLTPLDE